MLVVKYLSNFVIFSVFKECYSGLPHVTRPLERIFVSNHKSHCRLPSIGASQQISSKDRHC